MSSKISDFRNPTHLRYNSVFEPEVSALDFNSDTTSSARTTEQSAGVKIHTSVRRDATEGSLLVKKMNSHDRQFCSPQQTGNGTGHQVQQGDRVKNILNINVAADKFLLGTMGALSFNEEGLWNLILDYLKVA